ncbi:type IV pilin [Halobaculum sp. MBLA0143]|uniref:type IV pilin n=1 Tax=Halobaculum sp. MBLA0143 TaxID=3079933 RepID=UPI0035233931
MIQQLRNWTDDSDRAVSPVIGVILMVAITVILAAVIGSFVLGIGGDLEQPPQSQLSVSATENASGNLNVTIAHDGGDTLTGDNLRVIVENSSYFSQDGTADLEVGDQQTIGTNKSAIPSEVNVRIVHLPSDSLLVDTSVRVE